MEYGYTALVIVVVMFVLGWVNSRKRQQANRPGPPLDPATAPEEVVRLVRQGKKVTAIKAFREHTGASLKQAKDVVDRLDGRT